MTAREGDLLFVPPGTVHAFGAAPGSGADLLIVLTPGAERFEYFRLLDRVRTGDAAPTALLAVQERYDNHFVDSAVWRDARRTPATADITEGNDADYELLAGVLAKTSSKL